MSPIKLDPTLYVVVEHEVRLRDSRCPFESLPFFREPKEFSIYTGAQGRVQLMSALSGAPGLVEHHGRLLAVTSIQGHRGGYYDTEFTAIEARVCEEA